MKHFAEFQYDVEEKNINDLLEDVRSGISGTPSKEVLTLLFSILDLTSLSEKDNAENIGRLCEQVNLLDESYPGMPAPAAMCVYPELVLIARTKVTNPLVNIAAVGGGFPASQTFLEIKLKEVEMAIETGAEEIDIVLPVGKFLQGLHDEIFEEINLIKEIMGSHHLKVILETGSLPDLTAVRKASFLAMDAGADFIKTSTGKAGVGASPDSFAVMCLAIKQYYEKTGKKVGIKPAGGISDVETALVYHGIVKQILGDDWLNPEKFRIGASRLANALLAMIYDKGENFKYFS
jgi:deoxyribose-phosphate aldolase